MRYLRSFSVLWSYIRGHKVYVLFAGIALSAAAAATLAVPFAIRLLIDQGDFSSGAQSNIDIYFLVLIALAACLALASSGRFYFVSWLSERVISDIRKDILKHTLSLSPAFFDKTHSGDILSRLTADTLQIKNLIGISFSVALRNLLLFLGSLIMMVLTSPTLSVLVIGVIPFILLPMGLFGRGVGSRARRAQEISALAVSCASEAIHSVRNVQAFNAERQVADNFSKIVEQAFDAARAAINMRAYLTASAIFMVFFGIILVLWYGVYYVLEGYVTGGELGQFVLYAILAAGAIGELSQLWGEISQAAGAISRISEFLSLSPLILSPAEPRSLPVLPQGAIEFQQVSFAFLSPSEGLVLDSVSFSVKPREKLAIVGISGAGKSTLFHLLLRYYDPISGQVLLDGIPIRDASLKEVRARFSLVPQEPILFTGTIADNIAFGCPEATQEAIINAAHISFASNFIQDLPNGYNTLVGERGITLSAGQRQRIALARAILRNAPILLLDEATSALDAESEAFVQKGIDRLMFDRTTIMIAHRLSTVKRADRILVMDKGRIIEEGTHNTLSAGSGLYSRLVRLQFDDAAIFPAG